MRRRSEVAGLPVVRVDSGQTVGRVKGARLDLGHGRLEGFVVSCRRGGEAFLPFDQVHSLGPNAVTIGAEAVLLPAGASVEEGSGGSPLGRRVVTREGAVLGLVDDIIFDPESGAVWGYQVSGGFVSDFVNGKKAVPLTDEVVVGPDSVVVDTPAQIRPVPGEGGMEG